MELDQAVLDRVLEWGLALERFRPTHARNALIVVQGYVQGSTDPEVGRVEGIGAAGEDTLFRFAIDVAWITWLDDMFDSPAGSTSIDLESIISGIHGDASAGAAAGFPLVRSTFAEVGSGRDRQLWMDSAAEMVRAWDKERRLALDPAAMSYSEYIDNGIASGAVPHILATASILYDLDLAARLELPPVQRLVRNLAAYCRLHNDINGVAKDRREGCLANALLLVERHAPPDRARRFVEEELSGYRRMLQRDLSYLERDDPLYRLIRAIPAAHAVVYGDRSGAYFSPGQ